MNTKIKLTSHIGVFLTVFLLFPYQVLADFKDVPTSHPQYQAIHKLELKKIATVYPGNTFKPEKTITRAEFLKLVFNDIGFKAIQKKYNTGFKDVPAESWFSGYIQKALELKVLSPSQPNENFRPDKPITKAEATRITFALKGIPTPFLNRPVTKDLFRDIKTDSPLAPLAAAAKKNGVVSSKNPSLFAPSRALTRGDTAELLYQTDLIINKTTEETTLTPTAEPSVQGLDELSTKFISNPKFPILLDVWKKAYTEYYYPEKLDSDELMYGAIEGMVSKMGDPYTDFQKPLHADQLKEFLQGEFQGIGVEIDLVDDKLVIMKTIPSAPAERTGIKYGDVIDKIEGKSISGMKLDDVLKLIRGDVGTSIHLNITRNGQSLQFDVPREKIPLTSTSSKVVDNVFAVIDINKFTAATNQEFKKEIEKTLTENTKGIILDLRGNPGGYLDVANDILNHFIPGGKIIVSTKTNGKAKRDYVSSGKGELSKYPIIIIINEQSASASEILAGALQDHKIAKLVGSKSFGKGSVQKLYNYEDKSILKISIAHWFTPLGKDISGTGLKPDFEVAMTKEEILKGKDPQMDKALEEIRKMVR